MHLSLPDQNREVPSSPTCDPGSVPRLKRYLDEMPGNPVDTIWDDIQPVLASLHVVQVGYPTQKPLLVLGA